MPLPAASLATAGVANLRLVLLLCLLLTIPTFLSAKDAAPQRIEFSELGLQIDHPPGFTRAATFNGLEEKNTGASIVLVVLPGPYKAVTAGLNKEGLAARKILLHEREAVTVAGSPGILLDVEQSAYGRTFRKWIAAFGDEQKTHLITANYPAELVVELGPALRKAVLSVTTMAVSADASSKPLFAFADSDLLKPVAAVRAMGKMLAFSKSGRFPTAEPGEPIFIAVPSLGSPPIGEPDEAAVARLNSLADTDITKIENKQPISIDGMKGVEIVASATTESDKKPMRVYQVMLFPDSGGYYLMIGQVADAQAQAAQSMAEFRRLAASFSRQGK